MLVGEDPATVAVRAAVADAPPSFILAPTPGHGTGPVVPDLTGVGARDAIQALARLGLAPTIEGDGVVVNQEPPPGTPIAGGLPCRLTLARIAGRPTAGGEQP